MNIFFPCSPRFVWPTFSCTFVMSDIVTTPIVVTSDVVATLFSDQSHEIPQKNMTHFVKTSTTYLNASGQDTHTVPYTIAYSNHSEQENSTVVLQTAVILDGLDMITFLKLYFVPFLLFVGTLGNIMSFVIFSRTALRKSATAFYFRVLAVADTLALNVGLWPIWMRDAFDIHIYPITDVSCRIQTYLRYTLPDCAVWVLVILTIERLVGVRWPHHVRRIFTRHRSRISVLVMVLVIGIINIPSIFIATKRLGDTSIHPCMVAHRVLAYKIWPWIDLTIYSLLPFAIMITSIIVMLKTIKQRRRMLCRQGSINSSRGRTTQTMTATLLSVIFVFLLLTAPFVIYATILKELHGKIDIDFFLYYYIASYLRYVNNSVNFFLYCLSGQPFRTELKCLFLGRRPRISRISSSGTDVSFIDARRCTMRSNGIDTVICRGVDSIGYNERKPVDSPAESPVFIEMNIPSNRGNNP